MDSGSYGVETDLEEAAEVLQGALGPEEAPGQNRADLFTHRVEVGDEAVRHLKDTAEVTDGNAKAVTALSLLVCIYHLVNFSSNLKELKHFCLEEKCQWLDVPSL